MSVTGGQDVNHHVQANKHWAVMCSDSNGQEQKIEQINNE